MEKREATDEYCRKVVERLQSMNFSVASNVQYGNQTFVHVGKKAAFEIDKSGLWETLFILAEFDRIDVSTLWDYSRTCYTYALSKRRIPLPWGPWGPFHYALCYSVALDYGVDSAVADAVRNIRPPRHLTGLEFPVICDLATDQLHYLEKMPWPRDLLFDKHSFVWRRLEYRIVEVLIP